jgi:ApaG protein
MVKNSAISEGVQVSVTTQFRADISQVKSGSYFFGYRIDIENQNNFPIQLIHRDWFIFDSLNQPIHVSGEGVVGEKPLLEAGEIYHYTSGCELHSEIGNMHGFYTFKNMLTEDLFRVDIPMFQLAFPGKLN